jgi:FkbM family methyltransferase
MINKYYLKIRSLFEWIAIAWCAKFLSKDLITGSKIDAIPHLEKIGTNYGGWITPIDLIKKQDICYCVGVGEDISFDLGIIQRFGCQVYAFDPMPRAKQHVQKHAEHVNEFHFFDIGLWDKDEVVKLYAHSNPLSTSYSIINLHKTDKYLKAQCKRLSTIMNELGHKKIDLLKIDIEGAEYKVIESIIEDRLDIGVIFVEYDELHSKLYTGYLDRIKKSVSQLQTYGYTLVALKPKCDYTFIKNNLCVL